jgi:hypothetical protein
LYKVGVIGLLFLLVSAGCASTHKATVGNSDISQREVKDILKGVNSKNITGTGFFIRKGKIVTESESGRVSLFFTMKYSADGKYLISIRSRTGMEAFRVFISNDTILVNDRLNRNVLYGKNHDFEKISGIPASLLKISVGDFFFNKPALEGSDKCMNDEIRLNDYFAGLIINSTIDCKVDKLKSIIVSTGGPDKYITIDYHRFRDDTYSVPKKIEVNDSGRNIRIIISIEKYLAPWVGEIDFIPGTGYKRKPLI